MKSITLFSFLLMLITISPMANAKMIRRPPPTHGSIGPGTVAPRPIADMSAPADPYENLNKDLGKNASHTAGGQNSQGERMWKPINDPNQNGSRAPSSLGSPSGFATGGGSGSLR